MDDTVVKSKLEKEHANDLVRVLIRLIANNITIKMEKGVRGTKKLRLLGHLVQWGGHTWDTFFGGLARVQFFFLLKLECLITQYWPLK
jgi:hypothetical protein